MHTIKIELTLTPAGGRHIAFSKQMLEKAHVYRRLLSEGDGWEQIATNARYCPSSSSAAAHGVSVPAATAACTAGRRSRTAGLA